MIVLNGCLVDISRREIVNVFSGTLESERERTVVEREQQAFVPDKDDFCQSMASGYVRACVRVRQWGPNSLWW